MCKYTSHKNNCQKKQPAHFVITKRDSILRGSCFCDNYNTKTVQISTICTVLVLFAHGQDDIISICAWKNDKTVNSHATSNT